MRIADYLDAKDQANLFSGHLFVMRRRQAAGSPFELLTSLRRYPPTEIHEMNEHKKNLESLLRGRQYWQDLEKQVYYNNRQLHTADDVRKVVNSPLWYEAFLSLYWAIAEANYRRRTHKARAFDADVLRDIKADITERYFEEASTFADACEAVDGGFSLIDLKDHLCRKLGPRAKHDPKVPDFRGLTQVPRLRGSALEKAMKEEERRLGRELNQPERAAIARWPVMAFVPADQEGTGGSDEGGNAHDWLDILKDADPAWTDGHISALEEIISQEESDAFRQIMLNLMRQQAATVRRRVHGPVIWEAVIRYVALRAKDENYGELGELCIELGIKKKEDVEDVLYNLSRNLISAIVRKRPDLANQLGKTSRKKALREIARRNGPKKT